MSPGDKTPAPKPRQPARRRPPRGRPGALPDGSRRGDAARGARRVRVVPSRQGGRRRRSIATPMPPSSATSSPASSAISASSTRRSTPCSSPGWPLPRIDMTLRAILRSGAYELRAARTCRRAWSSPNMSTSPRPSSTPTCRAWSTASSMQLARVLRPAEFMAPAARSEPWRCAGAAARRIRADRSLFPARSPPIPAPSA